MTLIPWDQDGKVTKVRVAGHGAGKAELEFELSGGGNRVFRVLKSPTHEPQVFSSMAALVLGAYWQKARIRVSYVRKGPSRIAKQILVPVPPRRAVPYNPEPQEITDGPKDDVARSGPRRGPSGGVKKKRAKTRKR